MNRQAMETQERAFTVPKVELDDYNQLIAGAIQFLEDGGRFLVLENPKFYAVLSSMLKKDMSAESRIHFISDQKTCMSKLLKYAQYGEIPFLFLCHASDKDASFLKSIRENEDLAEIPIIVVSTEMYEEKVAYFCEKGADDIIVVPYTQNTIIEKIRDVVNPPEHLSLYRKAKKQLDLGNTTQAEEISRKLMDRYFRSAKAHELRGEICQAVGEFEKATKSYETACELETGKIYLKPRIRLVEVFKALGEKIGEKNPWIRDEYLRKELKYLEELDNLSPINVDRKLRQGEIYLGFGKNPQAEMILREAYELYTSFKRNKNQEDKDHAAEMAKKFISICGDNFPSLAHEACMDLIEDNGVFNTLSDNDRARIRLGNALALMGMAKSAWDFNVFTEFFIATRDELEALCRMDIDPEILAQAHYSQGELFELMGDKVKNENNPAGMMNFAQAYNLARTHFLRASKLQSRTDARERAMELEPESEATVHDLRIVR